MEVKTMARKRLQHHPKKKPKKSQQTIYLSINLNYQTTEVLLLFLISWQFAAHLANNKCQNSKK